MGGDRNTQYIPLLYKQNTLRLYILYILELHILNQMGTILPCEPLLLFLCINSFYRIQNSFDLLLDPYGRVFSCSQDELVKYLFCSNILFLEY